MWTAQKDAFRRKVADSEAENIVSVITLTFLFMFVSHQTSLKCVSPSSSSSFAATFDQTDQQREEIVQTC